MGFLFGRSNSALDSPPPGAMPPTVANPLLWALAAGKRKATSTNPGLAPLAKPVTTTQTSLLGG